MCGQRGTEVGDGLWVERESGHGGGVGVSPLGALDGGSPCRMSFLRNDNVACLCRLIFSLSPVEFKKCQCPMSLYYLSKCQCC